MIDVFIPKPPYKSDSGYYDLFDFVVDSMMYVWRDDMSRATRTGADYVSPLEVITDFIKIQFKTCPEILN